MIRELSEIKRTRKILGLSQQDLAFQAGVSQSLVAKTESGLVDPTYTKAKQIFDTLIRLREREQMKAKEIMNTSIITISPDNNIQQVITLMKENGISQIPVIDSERIIGLITEKAIIEHLGNKNIQQEAVQNIMEDCPPIVSPHTNHTVLTALLKEDSFLLVSDKGTIQGIISRTDLIGKV